MGRGRGDEVKTLISRAGVTDDSLASLVRHERSFAAFSDGQCRWLCHSVSVCLCVSLSLPQRDGGGVWCSHPRW